MAVVVVMFGASACSSVGDTFVVDDYLKAEITGDTFAACSARAYHGYALIEARRDVNYIDAARFVRKSQAAANGTPDELWVASDRGATADQTVELTQARSRAIAALSAAGADNCVCGGVPASYDAWVANARVGGWSAARTRFTHAVEACERGGKSSHPPLTTPRF
jgi:hypothetical protein